MKSILETERLKLIPKTLELVKATYNGTTYLEDKLGVSVDDNFYSEEYVLKIFPLQYIRIKNDETLSEWSGFIVEKANNRLIGTAGFVDKPNKRGEIEIKFFIHPYYRRNGFGTEMVKFLTDHFFKKPDVQVILAVRVSEDNVPALKIVKKIGMKMYYKRNKTLSYKLEKNSSPFI